MAGIAMNKALLSLALLAFLPLVACGPQGDQSSGDEAPLAGAKIGGNFTLVDQEGRKVSYSDFDVKHRRLYFGYNYCTAVCPMRSQARRVGKADGSPVRT